MVAHEKRNSAQLFCAVPTRNDLALSSLLFPAQPTQKLEYPGRPEGRNCKQMIKNRPPVHRQAIQTGKCKKPRRVCARRRKEIPIIFSGGMYGGENTARLANARIGHLWCPMRALQRAASFSNESPAQRVSFESACALSGGRCRRGRGRTHAASRASAHGGGPPRPPSARGGGAFARPPSARGGAPATARSR